MKEKSLGFIGGGRITRIFLQAFENKNASFSSIIVSDTNSDVLNMLKESFPKISVTESPTAPARQDIVFIALHPRLFWRCLETSVMLCMKIQPWFRWRQKSKSKSYLLNQAASKTLSG